MKTKILQAGSLLKSSDLEIVASAFKKGAVIAIPTETVYGLAASISNEKALKEIFRIKGRPQDNPLIVHISSYSQLETLTDFSEKLLIRLAERFWPGPLTLVLKKKEGVSDLITAGLSTVAVRMPSNPTTLQILEKCGPLAAPSANLSGRPSPTSIQDVLEDIDGLIEWAVDGGPSVFGIESTVLSLSDGAVTLLRPGAICREELEEFLGEPLKSASKKDPIASPGMKYRHYAPKAKVHLVRFLDELERWKNEGAFILDNVEEKTLYRELRMADRLGKEEIVIYLNPSILSNEALMNRLEKASQ